MGIILRDQVSNPLTGDIVKEAYLTLSKNPIQLTKEIPEGGTVQYVLSTDAVLFFNKVASQKKLSAIISIPVKINLSVDALDVNLYKLIYTEIKKNLKDFEDDD